MVDPAAIGLDIAALGHHLEPADVAQGLLRALQRDLDRGWNDYGVGEVRAILYDQSGGFNYYEVFFPTAHGQWITQYNYWDLSKVEA